MARRIYSFEHPSRFVAGALGKPGNRTFYLQVREGTTLISVVLEKVQVGVLGERLVGLLDEVRSRGADIPAEPPESTRDDAPLEEPISEVFRVGTLAIVWDGDDETVIVEARAMTEADEEDEEDEEETEETTLLVDEDDESDMVRVRLEPAQALAFARRALGVVAAGRPPCPFCGEPLNPEGHICARRNGFMH